MRAMSAAFDTLRLARTLRDKAKFSPEQAEGLADAMAEAMQGDLATKAEVLAVKTDVLAVRTDLRAELREVELRLGARIEATKADLIKWVVGMIGFQTIVSLGAALALDRAFTK
jgi:hypothetical protein